jgi:hypothetical protein
LQYFKLRLSKLNPFERTVILLIDEMYISGQVDFCGGEFVGFCDGGRAKTVLCFMISSVCGGYRDIVRLIPIKQITADQLHHHFLEVIRFIEDVGFTVVAVCSDNHPVNRSFYTNKLCNGVLKEHIEHPCRPLAPLFILFDSTHNIKNVYNNFERKKLFVCPPLPQSLSSHLDIHDNFTGHVTPYTASFHHIEQLYHTEADKPVKAARKLTKACLKPSAIEKSSVKFTSALFHESTHSALTHYSSSIDQPSWISTAVFLQLFAKLWKVLNVKTPHKVTINAMYAKIGEVYT